MLVIPVHKIVVLPHAVTYLRADAFAKSTGKSAEAGEKVILLLTKEHTERGDLTSESFQPLAVTGVIGEESVSGFIGIRTLDRVGVDDAAVMDGKISLSVSPRPEIQDFSAQADSEMFHRLKEEIIEFASHYEWGGMTRQLLSYCDNLSGLIAVLSPFMELSAQEQYALLAEDSLQKRAEQIERTVLEFLEMAKLSGEGQEKREQDVRKIYRESAIKKQIAYSR